MVEKIFSNYLFRVMASWFAEYVKQKTLEPIKQAQAISTQTIAQAQAIADTFTIINVSTQDNVEEIVNAFAANPEAEQLTVTQQWHGETAAQEHTVYRNIIYIGGAEV